MIIIRGHELNEYCIQNVTEARLEAEESGTKTEKNNSLFD